MGSRFFDAERCRETVSGMSANSPSELTTDLGLDLVLSLSLLPSFLCYPLSCLPACLPYPPASFPPSSLPACSPPRPYSDSYVGVDVLVLNADIYCIYIYIYIYGSYGGVDVLVLNAGILPKVRGERRECGAQRG
jgi:hypothetical protein